MTKSFVELLEASFKNVKTSPGSIVQGVVIGISKNVVLVDSGLKSESSVPIEEFYNTKGELEVVIGDLIDFSLDTIEDGFGETVLSREKAKRYESWMRLEQAYKDVKTVTGVVNGKVKGGFTVELDGIRAFLPGSLIDVRPLRDNICFEGQVLEFKVIKLDKKRNNVVVSRRAIIESENNSERNQLLNKLKDGIEIKGIVKNLTDYGAFIDLGGVDGLLHITDMSWRRVKHPSDIVNIGKIIKVKILKFDRERVRVSLGLKQLTEDPWITVIQQYQEGDRLKGTVTNLTDYGCFIEIDEGIEGLVHVSEMDWTNKNIHPSKVVSVGEKIEVMVLDVDKDRRRISLGLKQCKINPWKKFSESYNKGDRISGKIKSITDFGIFIGLDNGIDGLVHLSDVSWNISYEESICKYKKGDEITAMILQIDSDRERISLGIKQLYDDPLNIFFLKNKKGTLVSAEIIEINEKGIVLTLDKTNNIIGFLKFSDELLRKNEDNIIYEKMKDYFDSLNIGSYIKVKLEGIDRKKRIILLSVDYNHLDKISKCQEFLVPKRNHCSLSEKTNFSNNVMIEAFKAATKTTEN